VAALAVFTRVALTAFPGILLEWQQIVVFVAIASMVLCLLATLYPARQASRELPVEIFRS